MPQHSFIFQAITEQTHHSAIRSLLEIDELDTLIFSTAFINAAGILSLKDHINTITLKPTIYTGLRNGVTTAQGLKEALALGCTLYGIDTATRQFIFHPKFYLATSSSISKMIIGSANLTGAGISTNIEASVLLELDNEDPSTAPFIDGILGPIDGMVSDYPDHVISIPHTSAVDELLAAGRVIDEDSAEPPSPRGGSSGNRDLDTTPRMRLRTRPLPTSARRPRRPAQVSTGAAGQAASVSTSQNLELVWEGPELTRRYLNIPTSSGTHATGSMFFSRGNMQGIDQRHYFRDVVFYDLPWQFDTTPSRSHYERVDARFQIIIKGVDYGVYTLRVSHNTRTDTASYAQRNSMTQLHWGSARPIVAREDLLGRRIYLYKDLNHSDLFVLEID